VSLDAAPAEINWDDPAGGGDVALEAGPAEINWDADPGDAGGVSLEAAPAEINWDTGDAENSTPAEIDWGADSGGPVSISADSASNPAAKPAQVGSLNLLADPDFRESLQNDLLEMEGFFRERLRELKAEDNVEFANQFQGASPLLQNQSSALMEAHLQAVEQVLGLVSSPRLLQLSLIQRPGVYLDRLAASLAQKLTLADRLRAKLAAAQDKQKEAATTLQATLPELQEAVHATKTLKSQVESSLSKLYDGREVNIIGDINTM